MFSVINVYLSVFSFGAKSLFFTSRAIFTDIHPALLFCSFMCLVAVKRKLFIFRTYKAIFLFIINKMIAVIRILCFLTLCIHLLIGYVDSLTSFIQFFKIVKRS